jgi:hypothetical protein
MITPGPIALQELPDRVTRLTHALGKAGIPGARLAEILGAVVDLHCVECGYPLAGSDILGLAQPLDPTTPDDPKVARLRLHYCARNTCHSHYYHFELRPHPEIDWRKVNALATGLDAQEEAGRQADAAEQNSQRAKHRRAQLLRVGAGLLLLIVLWALRQWYTGGTIPLVREPHKFQADPQSLDITPAR